MPLVILSGALANKPFNGGNAWSRLSWVEGFQRLGYEVCFVEQLSRDACIDGSGQSCSFEQSVNLAYFKQTMAEFGLTQASSLIYRDGEQIHGLPMEHLVAQAMQASLLFNFSGHLTLPKLKSNIRHRLYYDDDPGYTQFWQAAQNQGARLWDHDSYFTIGENIGKPFCNIPTGEITWRHTRPPVVLQQWPVQEQPALSRFTTVASWRGPYGPIQYQGQTYGLKVHEFRKFLTLPEHCRHPFEIALQIHAADKKDLDSLLSHGWIISDPKAVADSAAVFRHFVQNSSAEFSVAQGVYVDTQSGWFSDRTVRYLASGKPVLVQDTGFSRNYPVGEGIISFRTLEEAVDGAQRIERDYSKHCQAARRLAEQFFDADKVIRALAKEIGLKLP